MFEGFTLEQQRVIEAERGWKPTYSALTYCTAEAVIFRRTSRHIFLDTEVLVATRTSGAPDCLGKKQSKWGGYTRPSDATPVHAMKRSLNELFGWDAEKVHLQPAGIIGPWLYRSTMSLDEKMERLVLSVSNHQAEQTPFQATLFLVTVPFEFDLGHGTHTKSTQDARWMKLRDLIEAEGANPDHLYWQMLFTCARTLIQTVSFASDFVKNFMPGEHLCHF